jgi:hypothetical protein
VNRTSLGFRAALAAALLIFFLPFVSEGKTSRKGGKSRSIQRSERSRPTKQVRRARHKPRRGKKARKIIQNRNGRVVLELVRATRPQVYGPFLPAEHYDYPRLPCPALDPVITAELHETDAQTPEVAVAESVIAPPSEDALARIARKVGLLFRPKSASARVQPQDVDLSDLLSKGFLIPVEGVDAEKLRDSFLESRGRHAKHLAIDIGAPRGTPILATADGEVIRLAKERRGGISIYQKDAAGQHLFFYCHLSRYAEGLTVGQKVARGDVIGYVGSTGRVRGGPHLHFSITRLPEEDGNFREGLAINPYLLFLAGVP